MAEEKFSMVKIFNFFVTKAVEELFRIIINNL